MYVNMKKNNKKERNEETEDIEGRGYKRVRERKTY
jgi:hypothetical protein